MLTEVEPLLNGFTLLERRAKSRSSGGDSYIYLSVDSLYPYERLFAALAEFTKQFPFVHPILRQSTYISPSVEFASHGAGLCIAQRSPQEPLSQPILDVRLRAVARADHPLNILGRQLTQVDLLQHLAAMIEGPLRNESSRQPRNPAQRFLSISTIEAAIEAVRSGMCFGWLPLYRIEQFLNSGELVGLNLPIGAERTLRLHIISKDMDITSREQGVLANLFGANRSPEMI
jgi:DNA-binding transcriptional LysR family regulator